MDKINFQDATLTSQAKVTIDNVDYEVTPPVYSGGTDLNAETFNTMQNNIEEAISYSTEEQPVGKWINGKPIYRKVVPLGTLPNQDTIQVSSGLDSNIVRIVHIYGVATDKTNYETFPIPFSWGSNTEIQNFCGLFFGGTGSSGNVWFRTNRNMSNYEGYVILEYTKTTD